VSAPQRELGAGVVETHRAPVGRVVAVAAEFAEASFMDVPARMAGIAIRRQRHFLGGLDVAGLAGGGGVGAAQGEAGLAVIE